MRYTITATELYNGLANTIHFAGNEKSHPILNSVRISTYQKTVLFTTASRDASAQVIAEPVIEPGDNLESSNIVIPSDQVKALMAFVKLGLKEDQPIVMENIGMHLFAENPLQAEVKQVSLVSAEDYPEVDALWPLEPVGLNVLDGVRQVEPHLLSKLSKVRAHTKRAWYGTSTLSIGLGQSSAEPILVTYRDWFRAIIRPLNPGAAAGPAIGVDPNPRFTRPEVG